MNIALRNVLWFRIAVWIGILGNAFLFLPALCAPEAFAYAFGLDVSIAFGVSGRPSASSLHPIGGKATMPNNAMRSTWTLAQRADSRPAGRWHLISEPFLSSVVGTARRHRPPACFGSDAPFLLALDGWITRIRISPPCGVDGGMERSPSMWTLPVSFWPSPRALPFCVAYVAKKKKERSVPKVPWP
jgi:hypothetical protein